MRKKLFTFLLAIVASVGTMFAETYSGSCGELTWSLNTEDSVLTISGTGSMEAYASSKTTPWYSNRQSIKSIVIEDGVVSIGKYAFSECNSLTAITIPNSVIFIGSSAFSGCSGLTAVTIPDSVVLIEGAAFYGCSSLNAVNIYDLAAWCNIKFSASTSNPLYYAKNLYLNGTLVEKLVIPDGITKINDYAFYNCGSLTSVTIPNSVTSIGKSAFSGCKGLTSVNIPNSVTTIESSAFVGCSSLNAVNISDLAAWCNISFKASFSNPLNYAKNLYLNGTLVKDLVIPNGVTKINDYAFYNCSSLTSVTIPNSVTSIGTYSFYGCNVLASITIPNGVTSIGEYAFNGCKGLTSVNIPNSVTTIESSAFSGCSNLTAVYISDLTAWCHISFGFSSNPLNYAKNLYLNGTLVEELVIPDGITKINDYAFYGCSSITSVFIPNGVTSIGKYAFNGCKGLTSVNIPNSVTTIESSAFSTCSGLTAVYISDLTAWCNISFGSTASNNPLFYAKNLYLNGILVEKLVIPDGITKINDYAFYGCSSITSVTIPNSVTSIGNSAFYKCSGLASITIPNSVTSIGSSAFYNCTGLTSITNLATTPQAVSTYVFGNPSSNTAVDYSVCTLYVPAESVEAYKAADVWKEFTNILPIGESSDSCVIASGTCGAEGDNLTWTLTCDSVLTISGMGAIKKFNSTSRAPWYEYRESIKFAVIEEGVTSIGNLAFRDCSVLKSVTIPNSVISIGYDAFGYCSNLTSVIIPNSITSIGSYAFSRSGLTSVTLSNNLTTIETDVFMDCSNLTSVIIPNSITSIRGSAFQGCSGMTSVTFGNGITSIGDLAFCDCNALTNITIPNSVTSIGVAPFSGCDNLTSINVTSDNTNYCSIDGVLFSKDKTALIQYPCGKQGTYTIPNSVISIGEMAFAYCPTLSSITIPSNVTSIDQWAFDSNSLNSITNYATNPQAIHTNVFSHVDKSTCTLYVPAQCLAAYQAADVWKEFGNILPIEESGEVEVLSIAEAIQIGMALDSMATSAETYTIEGYVINAGTFYAGAKYQNWYMTDDQETTSSDFQAYKCYPIDGIDTVEVRNGSKVRMTGKLQKYYNRSTGKYIVEMTYTPALILSTPVQPPLDTITVVEALAIGATLADHAATAKQYVIRGYVSSVSPYVEQYGYQNFYIADEPNSTANSNAAGGFYVYRGIPSTGTAVTVGNLVELICAIQKYISVSGTITYIENSENPIPVTVLQVDTMPCVIASGTCGAEGGNLTWTLTCDSVLTISGTGAMEDYEWQGTPWYTNSGSIKSVTIPNSVTSIGKAAFQSCTALTSVTIGNNITNIGNWAFIDCNSLTSIEIPNSVTSIGDGAFAWCTGLTSVTIPNSVTSIGIEAFSVCSGLTSINVASDNSNYCSVDGVLFNKDKTTLIQYPGGKQGAYTIPNSVTSIGDFAFEGCTSLTSVTIPNSVTSIGGMAFSGCYRLTSVTIPNSVTSIGGSAFYGCSGLTSVTIPNSITSIGNGAFIGCRGLTSVTIPNSVTSIGGYAFEGCTGLTSVTIPNSVTSIGDQAFSNCYGLTSVVIPNGVTNIGSRAFYGCSSLTSVTNYATTPQQIESDVFGGTSELGFVDKSACTLHVPAESVEAYQAADVWKEFGQILPINAEDVDVTETTVTASATTADIVWPKVTGAATYSLEIKKNGELICTLTFDEEGHMISMSFAAPSRDNTSQQTQAASFSFTITGLESGTTYNYMMTVKDNNGNVLKTESGTFTTIGAVGIEDAQSDQVQSTKILRNGQIFIQRGEKIYTITGQKIQSY